MVFHADYELGLGNDSGGFESLPKASRILTLRIPLHHALFARSSFPSKPTTAII